MVVILKFSSGNEVVLNDGKLFLTYGKKLDGSFIVSFEEIYKNVFLNEDTFVESIRDENGQLIFERLKDYDGEVFVSVESLPQNRKVGNNYFAKFDVYESMIIKAIAIAVST